MDIRISLYDGNMIALGPIDHEKDAEIEAQWTNDPEYLRMLDPAPAFPQTKEQIKKKYEEIEKETQEKGTQFYFTIREKVEDVSALGRLIGFVMLSFIEWTHGVAQVKVAVGSPHDRRKGYGFEALMLILRYAFAELNLYRLTALIPEYNLAALRLFEKAGFTREVTRRQAIYRDGKRWDLIQMGILREEWEASPASGRANRRLPP